MADEGQADLPDIAALAGSIAACRLCRDAPQGRAAPLPHAPRPVVVLSTRARILIAGQAPGLRVHESGIPFNDASGDRLRQWLAVDRDTFYDPDRLAILPMGFCFPGYDGKGADKPPRRECAPRWRQQALALMPQIDLVLAVGLHAQTWHLGGLRRPTLHDTVAAWQDYARAGTGGKMVLPLPHPSWRNSGWLGKNLWFERDYLPFLRQMVKNRLS